MQSFLRGLALFLTPFIALLIASRFGGLKIAGKDLGELAGAPLAGTLVLVMEVALTQGTKRSARLRRWLDPRAAFEGAWIQTVYAEQAGNKAAVFWMDYTRADDSFAVSGQAYSSDGRRWAKWTSSHMFIDAAHLKATCIWEGEIVLDQPIPHKSGLTELMLKPPPNYSLPVRGDGEVSHVGESTSVQFELERVTDSRLKEYGLPFKMRDLKINAHDEERNLVEVLLAYWKTSSQKAFREAVSPALPGS